MTEKNQDGFEPGQELSFDELMKMRSAADADSAPATAGDIAKMKKAEVVEQLKQNGVEAPEGGVDVLRDQLTAILFPDA